MSEEWGPWIEHDGRGCPVRGQWVQSEDAMGEVREHIAGGLIPPGRTPGVDCWNAWDWGEVAEKGIWEWRIIRYRVRKPRALSEIKEALRKMDAPVREDA